MSTNVDPSKLVKMQDQYNGVHWVLEADLAGGRLRLRRYNADGTRLMARERDRDTGKFVRVYAPSMHRDNITRFADTSEAGVSS